MLRQNMVKGWVEVSKRKVEQVQLESIQSIRKDSFVGEFMQARVNGNGRKGECVPDWGQGRTGR